MVYIDRLINNEIISGISFHNVHRLLAVSIMASVKFNEDVTFKNKRWSGFLGIPLRELNDIEAKFLMSLKFDLRVQLEDLHSWMDSIFRFVEQERLDNHNEINVDFNCSKGIEAFKKSDDVTIDL